MKRILGTGIFNLDTIVVREYPNGPQDQMRFVENTVAEEVGGTCGNVMCMLSYLGWEVYPLAVLDTTEEGYRMTESMKRYGCNMRFVSNVEGGGTTLLRVTHKLEPDGSPKVSVRSGSPGGSRYPRRHFLRMRDEAPAFLEYLDFVPDVFFFDDPAAGHRVMAKALRSKGSLIYFEPSAIKEKKDFDAINQCDVIKFSGENIQDTSFAEDRMDKLFIQTLGSEGLRFNLKGAGWVSLPPVANDNVVDWEGAGDWTTSAFLNALAEAGCLSLDKMTEDVVRAALEKAQVTASRSVSYMGSKGMINDDLNLNK